MIDVLVIGSINVDHVVLAPRFPGPGETIIGNGTSTGLGGKGCNQAVAAALAGARTAILARVGADAEGAWARERLGALGVDTTSVVVVDGVETGSAWITVARGDNTIVVVPGANHAWPDEPRLTEARVLLAQLEIPPRVVLRAAARAHPARFVLNAAPAAEVADELLTRCDVLIVNEHEQNLVAGLAPGTPVPVAHARLRERGATAVVTTLGEAGAVVTDSDGGVTEVPALRTAEVVDTTGAGDAFAGVLAARLAAGDSLPEAVRWGAAAGSLAVRATGAQASYPDTQAIRAALGPAGESA